MKEAVGDSLEITNIKRKDDDILLWKTLHVAVLKMGEGGKKTKNIHKKCFCFM